MPAAVVSVIFRVTPTLQILILVFSEFSENLLLIHEAILEWWDGCTGTQVINRVENKDSLPYESLDIK
jgi:hypothetical protein